MASVPLERKNRRVGLLALLAAVAMLGLGYAAVPLYDLFCRVTGFGGTTQVASAADAARAAELSAGRRPSRSASTPTPRATCRGPSGRGR